MARKRTFPRIHAAAGSLAFLVIAAFLVSSIVVELAGDPAAIAAVKRGIAWTLLVLVPALAAAGATGFMMVGGRPAGLAGAKLARMRWIAGNGILVLVPAALYLFWKAGLGEFDGWFALVQGVEFVAGGANLVLMGLNIRDGLRMSGRLRRRPARSAG